MFFAAISGLQAQDNSWIQTNGPYGAKVNSLLVDSSGAILAGTDGGLYRSIDDGAHWTCIGFVDSTVSNLVTARFGKIFCTAGYGLINLWSSTNGGMSWNGVPFGDAYGVAISVAVAPNGDVCILCPLTGPNFAGSVILRSTDNGATWIDVGLRDSFGGESLVFGKGGGIFVGSVGGGELFHSTDNGTSWSLAKFSGRSYSLAVDSSGHVFAGSDTGVYASTDNGNSWHLSGLKQYSIQSIYVAPFGKIFASAVYPEDRVYCSSDDGTSWVPTGMTYWTLCFVSKPNGDLFAGTKYDCVFRSANNGADWSQVGSGMINTIIYSLAVESDTSMLAGVGGYGPGIWRTIDKGESWQRIAFVDTAVAVYVDKIGRTFACSDLYGMWLSTDRGNIWRQVFSGSTDCVATDSAGRIFMGLENAGIRRSTDGGVSWTSVYGIGTIRSIAICRDSSVVAAAVGGIIHSTDHGATWTTVISYVEGNYVLMDKQGNVFAATNDDGVFRSSDNGGTWSSLGGRKSNV